MGFVRYRKTSQPAPSYRTRNIPKRNVPTTGFRYASRLRTFANLLGIGVDAAAAVARANPLGALAVGAGALWKGTEYLTDRAFGTSAAIEANKFRYAEPEPRIDRKPSKKEAVDRGAADRMRDRFSERLGRNRLKRLSASDFVEAQRGRTAGISDPPTVLPALNVSSGDTFFVDSNELLTHMAEDPGSDIVALPPTSAKVDFHVPKYIVDTTVRRDRKKLRRYRRRSNKFRNR